MSTLLLILKILLFVIIGLVALLSILLFTARIKVRLIYVEYFSAEIRALGIRLLHYDTKNRKVKETTEAEEESEQEEASTAISKKAKQKKHTKDIINEFKEMFFELVGKFRKHVKLERLDIKALVSTDDPAKTALIYPEVCTVGACIAEYASNIKNSRKDCVHVKITPDFFAEKSDVDIRLCISVKLIHIASMAKTVRKILQTAKKYK